MRKLIPEERHVIHKLVETLGPLCMKENGAQYPEEVYVMERVEVY